MTDENTLHPSRVAENFLSVLQYLQLGLNTGILLVVLLKFSCLPPRNRAGGLLSDGQSLVIVHSDRYCTAGITAILGKAFPPF